VKRYCWSTLAAAVPFAFALIRALTTGSDVRYLWVALASLVGAAVTATVVGGLRSNARRLIAAPAIFVFATFMAVAAALVIGTRLGLGILIVGAAFGFWFAVAGHLYLRARA
jgi:hypothetical protein